jgi:nitrate reductase NapE
MQDEPANGGRRMETAVFIFLAFILFPALSMILIGGLGFVIWMKQLLLGAPPLS